MSRRQIGGSYQREQEQYDKNITETTPVNFKWRNRDEKENNNCHALLWFFALLFVVVVIIAFCFPKQFSSVILVLNATSSDPKLHFTRVITDNPEEVTHRVTQVLQQTSSDGIIPPFINNDCVGESYNTGGSSPDCQATVMLPYAQAFGANCLFREWIIDLNTITVVGSNPIDWPTFQLIEPVEWLFLEKVMGGYDCSGIPDCSQFDENQVCAFGLSNCTVPLDQPLFRFGNISQIGTWTYKAVPYDGPLPLEQAEAWVQLYNYFNTYEFSFDGAGVLKLKQYNKIVPLIDHPDILVIYGLGFPHAKIQVSVQDMLGVQSNTATILLLGPVTEGQTKKE